MQNIGVVMGGGIESNGKLPQHVSSRVEAALKREAELSHLIFSSRYTLNKPQVRDSEGFVITEAAAMAQYFRSRSKRHDMDLFLELASTDTIGSALHTRSLLENVGIVVGNLKIFTSDWHVERTRHIFNWALSLKSVNLDFDFQISCLGVIDEHPSVARIEKERNSLENFLIEWAPIKDLNKAWKNLFLSHDNYNLKNNSITVNTAELKY